MITRRAAFSGSNSLMVAHAILTQPVVPPQHDNRDVSPGLCAIIGRATEKNRDLRYQRATDVRDDLERVRIGLEPIAAHTHSAGRTSTEGRLQVTGAGEPWRLRRLTFNRGTVYAARFAPDGQTVL